MYESPVVYNLDGGNGGNGGGAGMWGGDGSWIFAFLIIALIFGDRWGLGGNSGSSGTSGGDGMAAFLPYIAGSVTGGGALTRGELCQDMNFADVQSGVRSINDAVNGGFAALNSTICHQQYDTAGLINGLGINMMQGFNAANVVALQNQNALQTQMAQCCCNLERGLDGINYNMASNTSSLQNTIQTGFRDSIEATQAGTRAILDYLCQEKIADLQSENQALRLSASQAKQNQYLIDQLRPTPVPAYPAASPCGLGNWSPAVLTGGYGYQGYGYGGCGI